MKHLQLHSAAPQSIVSKGVGVKRAREAFPIPQKGGPIAPGQRASELGSDEQRRWKKQRSEAPSARVKALGQKGAKRVAQASVPSTPVKNASGQRTNVVVGMPPSLATLPHLLAGSCYVTNSKEARVGGVANKLSRPEEQALEVLAGHAKDGTVGNLEQRSGILCGILGRLKSKLDERERHSEATNNLS